MRGNHGVRPRALQPWLDTSPERTARPLTPANRPFDASIVDGLTPLETAAEPEPGVMVGFNRPVATGKGPDPAGAEPSSL